MPVAFDEDTDSDFGPPFAAKTFGGSYRLLAMTEVELFTVYSVLA